ncbi:peptidoglycan-associated lipoprotein [Thiomicrorhabdus immobilis]|uniref:Peptidoglycan-associated lipoprotein n=1 Tax=Thiomicrorhabdus immobilis TaxID=2791037 RepID=A0ABN6CW99_9GAMM|nr:peptidoglycan-associated lipoprotein Pal [Thiomicrorhabdus immobilis]BCN92949.1 peptidoglycan-associated lipoprotein [Thiomicrorhabdus immobilis]
MSFKSITQLFLVGFLGFTLVGCSSTPKTDSDSSNKDVATNQVDADIEAAKRAAAERAAADLEAKKAELKAAIDGKVVHFDFDMSEIRPSDYALIKAHADYMSLVPGASLTVSGYCDERGTREYNLALGERRANAVQNALVAEGVSPSRINVISFGEDNPVDEAHSESAWAKNRRAEFSY